MTVEETVRNLDEGGARQILEVIARHRLASGAAVELMPDERRELASAFELADGPLPAVSEAELARQALLVLAEDPATRAAIESMAAQSAALVQKFDFGVSLGITVAALVVLQTRVRFERGKDGKCSLIVEKKAASDALLKGFVQKLLGFIK
jgi:hypothetical protein